MRDVKLQFDEAQVDIGKVLDAEQLLIDAGVRMDTGMYVGGTHGVREWFLDTAKGVNVEELKDYDEEAVEYSKELVGEEFTEERRQELLSVLGFHHE